MHSDTELNLFSQIERNLSSQIQTSPSSICPPNDYYLYRPLCSRFLAFTDRTLLAQDSQSGMPLTWWSECEISLLLFFFFCCEVGVGKRFIYLVNQPPLNTSIVFGLYSIHEWIWQSNTSIAYLRENHPMVIDNKRKETAKISESIEKK